MQSPAQATISSRTPYPSAAADTGFLPPASRAYLQRLAAGSTAALPARNGGRPPDDRAGVSGRQREAERRPAPLAGHADSTARALDKLLHDREPDPGAAALTGPRLLDPVEPLPDAREILRRDAGPGVRDADVEPVRRPFRPDLDTAALGRVADGVLEQVREHLGELVGAHASLEGRRDLHHHLDRPAGEGRRHELDGTADQGGDVDVTRHAGSLLCAREDV